MKRFQAAITLLAVMWSLAASAVQGQTREQEQRQPETIRVDTSLVSVPVSVTDRTGRFVTGLTRVDFQVLEDGKPQEIASFSAAEAPFNVALLIDTSRSTRELLGTIRKAARNFIKQLQPQDRVLIVTFDEQVNFPSEFTSNRRQLQRAINGVKSSYLTSIYDAISFTINQKLAPINGRKAIVVFSDGVDTWSKQANYDSTLDLVARSGVLVYAVQYNTNNIGGSITSPFRLPGRNFFTPFVPPQQDRLRQEMQRQITAANFLRALATQSGARHLQAETIENSERAFALIADELRHQYTLEYYSTNERRDGGYRSIKVQLGRDDVAIRARQGYRAPKADNGNRESKPPNQSNP
jgi:Ca-activated chloride channel family protein